MWEISISHASDETRTSQAARRNDRLEAPRRRRRLVPLRSLSHRTAGTCLGQLLCLASRSCPRRLRRRSPLSKPWEHQARRTRRRRGVPSAARRMHRETRLAPTARHSQHRDFHCPRDCHLRSCRRESRAKVPAAAGMVARHLRMGMRQLRGPRFGSRRRRVAGTRLRCPWMLHG